MVTAPRSDADVPGFLAGLGIPGLADVHVHFMPPRVMAAVWRHFELAGPFLGREWPVLYKSSDDERVERLRALGVRRFTALPYAHKPGIATFLNEWAWTFAASVPECIPSATFFPEPEAGTYVAAAIEQGVRVFKAHVQVGDFELADPYLRPVFGALEDSGVPLVLHAGSGPVPNSHTGPEPVAGVLRSYPRLPLIIAHAGAPEYREFLELAERYERVRLDTTMVFTDFFSDFAAYPVELLGRFAALREKVLFGSDFPNIPYPYAHALEALVRLDLGDDWLADVCWHNLTRVFTGPGASGHA